MVRILLGPRHVSQWRTAGSHAQLESPGKMWRGDQHLTGLEGCPAWLKQPGFVLGGDSEADHWAGRTAHQSGQAETWMYPMCSISILCWMRWSNYLCSRADHIDFEPLLDCFLVTLILLHTFAPKSGNFTSRSGSVKVASISFKFFQSGMNTTKWRQYPQDFLLTKQYISSDDEKGTQWQLKWWYAMFSR